MSTPTLPPIRVLIVDSDEHLRATLAQHFQRQGMLVRAVGSSEEALSKFEHHCFDIALFALHLPGISGIDLLEKFKKRQPEAEVLMLTTHDSIETAILALRRGAYDYLTKPFHLAEVEIHLQKAFEKVQLHRRERQWLEHVRYESPRYRLIGSSPAMQHVVQMIEQVAPTHATVLIRGASGTGKELVARAIHYNSPRHEHPLVTINCAALQETLLESELFGHEKGAFTGAVQSKRGLLEVAEGGTLFIDEVAEMAPCLQAKLLRVLEDGYYHRLGGTQEVRANVRVVAATHKALEEEQKAGHFREDLYQRLNVFTIVLPPLCERREDIPELVEHFLTTRHIGPMRYRIQPETLEAMKRFHWPGNVRGLANVLERAKILAEDHLITSDDLPDYFMESLPLPATGDGDPRYLREVERRHVQEILRQEKGNKVQAAKALGISRRALYRLIEKYSLEEKHSSDGKTSHPSSASPS